MPVFQHALNRVHLKIVYYGPGMGGKTTNLQYLHANSRPEMRGKLISLATESERTLFFDLLPVELGVYRGYTVQLHLCTVPGQIALENTRRLVLQSVDGVVFVADSQTEMVDSNVQSVRDLEQNLLMQGTDPTSLPLVVQYNKRDLPNVMDLSQLRRELAIPPGTPEVEACARLGIGVGATLKAMVKLCLQVVGDPATAPQGRTASILPGVRASMFPGGRPPVLDQSIPPPPKLPRTLRRTAPTIRAARASLANPISQTFDARSKTA